MKYDPDKHYRRSIRLKEYDYSQPGAYFITICTQNREMLLNNPQTESIVLKWWDALTSKFQRVQIDECIIMPNHIHGIVFILDKLPTVSVGADPRVCPDEGQPCWIPTLAGEHTGSPLRRPTLGTIVQWFKTMTTNKVIRAVKLGLIDPFPCKLWQRNYYEHIIRSESDLNDIRQYIIDNPLNWEEDENNPGIIAEGITQ